MRKITENEFKDMIDEITKLPINYVVSYDAMDGFGERSTCFYMQSENAEAYYNYIRKSTKAPFSIKMFLSTEVHSQDGTNKILRGEIREIIKEEKF